MPEENVMIPHDIVMQSLMKKKTPIDLWRYRSPARTHLKLRDFKNKQTTVSGYVKKPAASEQNSVIKGGPQWSSDIIALREAAKREPNPESISSIKLRYRVPRGVARKIKNREINI